MAGLGPCRHAFTGLRLKLPINERGQPSSPTEMTADTGNRCVRMPSGVIDPPELSSPGHTGISLSMVLNSTGVGIS